MKKIMELVAAGNVLDERGHWVAIEEKIAVERQFLDHLSRGEILRDGIWVRMDMLQSLSQLQRDDHPVVFEETEHSVEVADVAALAMETPEETIDLSVETVAAFVEREPVSQQPLPVEADFPPETAELRIDSEEEHEENDHHHQFIIDGKTQIDFPIEALHEKGTVNEMAQKNNAEFEETVLFNIQALQKEIEERKKRGLPPRT